MKKNKKLIFVCSPYNGMPEEQKEEEFSILKILISILKWFLNLFVGSELSEREINKLKAGIICTKILEVGEAPYAPHLFFTSFLDEDMPGDREMAIAAGKETMKRCDEVWIFIHDGMSPGMIEEEVYAREIGKPVKKLEWTSLLVNKGFKCKGLNL